MNSDILLIVKKTILTLLISLFNFSNISAQSEKPVVITPARLTGIPYVITREKTKVTDAPVALFFSGDGGWNPFEQSIVDKLALNGIPTIGIDTKKYFWTRKTPEETTDDMIALFSYYSKEWGKTRFMLIGYSQGAEIVPFVATRLPDGIKSNMVSVVMLSPETTTDFEIHITNLLGLGSKKNIFNVIDEITRMKVASSLCIFGESEKTPVPGLLKNTTVNIAVIPGDHHYKFNATLIVQTMKNKNAF